jgi:hypothetical protein
MVSLINYSSIDATYPIAGKDNDSQGFRDNFGYIKNGLEIAQGEITGLQNNSALTSENNNFNNNKISGAVFTNNSDFFFDGGTVGSNTLVTYANGPYQKFTITGTLNLTLQFPILTPNTVGGVVYRMRVELIGNDNKFAVSFVGTGSTIITNNIPITIYIVSSVVSRIFDIWTTDAGDNIYVHEVGNNDSFYQNNNGSTVDIMYSSGKYQKFTISQNTDFIVGGFPPDGLSGKVTVELYGSGNTVTFSAENSDVPPTPGTLKMSTNVDSPIVIASTTDPQIFEFWSNDGGNTVFMNSLGAFS